MNIFNSLGSNYPASWSLKAIITKSDTVDRAHLISTITGLFRGRVFLFYKGRHALKAALEFSNLPPKSRVAVTGFTCLVVDQAITSAGYTPVFLDIDPQSLNFTPSTLRRALSRHSDIKAVVIQNTLGIPQEVKKIKEICQQRGVTLIEDLAHSIGTKYEHGVTAGSYGDFVVLSFSQDKIIDGISGGALIIKNGKYYPRGVTLFPEPNINIQIKDRFYPFLTFLIRLTYPLGLGIYLHKFIKELNLFNGPLNSALLIQTLPGWYARIAGWSLGELPDYLLHRRLVSQIYSSEIKPVMLSDKIKSSIPKSANIRFPIFVENRDGLLNYLKKSGLHFSDTWYDAPVSPRKLMKESSFKRGCPRAQAISKKIVNLPTHREVTEEDAYRISHIINAWHSLDNRK